MFLHEFKTMHYLLVHSITLKYMFCKLGPFPFGNSMKHLVLVALACLMSWCYGMVIADSL